MSLSSTVDIHKINHNETVDTNQSWTSTIIREPSIGIANRIVMHMKRVPNIDIICRGRGIVHD